MKSGTKKKLWLCFRPAVEEKRITGAPIIKYISKKIDDDRIGPAFLSSLSEKKEFSKVSKEKEESEHPKKKKSPRRIISRILKNRKVREDSHVLESAETEKFLDVTDEKSAYAKSAYEKLTSDDDRKIGSSATSFLFSSSFSSSSRFSSRSSSVTSICSQQSESKSSISSSDQKKPIKSNSLESKQSNNSGRESPKKTKTIIGYSNSGLYLLLACLVVMIFWGKIFAIICTSTCLYFVYCRNATDDQPENVMKSPEIDSKEYKKKVIMEGLLERNHHKRG